MLHSDSRYPRGDGPHHTAAAFWTALFCPPSPVEFVEPQGAIVAGVNSDLDGMYVCRLEQ